MVTASLLELVRQEAEEDITCFNIAFIANRPLTTWWRHQMETFSALLAICAGNSPVPGEFPTQRPVTRSFYAFFDQHPNKRLSKQWWRWWFETLSCPLWRHRNESKKPESIKFCRQNKNRAVLSKSRYRTWTHFLRNRPHIICLDGNPYKIREFCFHLVISWIISNGWKWNTNFNVRSIFQQLSFTPRVMYSRSCNIIRYFVLIYELVPLACIINTHVIPQ